MRNEKLLPFQGPRLIFFGVVIVCVFVIMVVRLYQYQFVQADEFMAAANENAVQSVPLPAPRGVIYDRYNVALAQNSPAWIVTVTPASLPDDEAGLAVLNRLSALIEVPATRAAANAAGKTNVRSLEEFVREGQGIAPYRPVVVKTDIDQVIAQQILEDVPNLPGVDVQWGAVRQYPTGATTSQLIGYLGPIGQKEADELSKQGYNPSFERTGFAGIEASMNDQLAGLRGRRTQKIDVAGRVIEGGLITESPAVAGMNIRLTIDLDLQRFAQSALVDEINKINTDPKYSADWSKSGVVVAMNPQTGEILSMVSFPTYDNARFARFIDAGYYDDLIKQQAESRYPLINNAISSLYPPGSTWKILTSIAVDNEKVIAPTSRLNDPGQLIIQDSYAPNDVARSQKFVCWTRDARHGQLDLVKAIAVSCDVYFYQVGGGNAEVSPQTLRPGGLGIINLNRYARAFGVGEPTLIELIGSQTGTMPDPEWKRRTHGESWSTGDTYNAAFGQGYVIMTPLQLANLSSAIANGGTLYHPTIVNAFVDSENNPVDPLSGQLIKVPAGQAPGAFKGQPMRTLIMPVNNSAANPAYLMLSEDTKIRGKDSIACKCEESAFDLNALDTPQAIRELYGRQIQDPARPDDPNAKIWVCDPAKIAANYRPQVRIDRDVSPISRTKVGGVDTSTKTVRWEDVTYTVYVPFDYTFSDYICYEPDFAVSEMRPADYDLPQLTAVFRDGRRIELEKLMGYQPPFMEPNVFQVTNEGMRLATKAPANPEYYVDPIRQGPYTGTAGPGSVQKDLIGFNLRTYKIGQIETAGKTGTAEYCDEIAGPRGLNICNPGSWPAHAWFLGYAPSKNPEILVVAFIYRGNEGAAHAMPVARKVTDCYFRLKDARAAGQPTADICKPGDDVPPPGKNP